MDVQRLCVFGQYYMSSTEAWGRDKYRPSDSSIGFSARIYTETHVYEHMYVQTHQEGQKYAYAHIRTVLTSRLFTVQPLMFIFHCIITSPSPSDFPPAIKRSSALASDGNCTVQGLTEEAGGGRRGVVLRWREMLSSPSDRNMYTILFMELAFDPLIL